MRMGLKAIWAVSIIASILILGTLGFSQHAEAATFTVTGSGVNFWNDPTTWDLGTVPGEFDDKIIPSNNSVRITSNVINSGQSLFSILVL